MVFFLILFLLYVLVNFFGFKFVILGGIILVFVNSFDVFFLINLVFFLILLEVVWDVVVKLLVINIVCLEFKYIFLLWLSLFLDFFNLVLVFWKWIFL